MADLHAALVTGASTGIGEETVRLLRGHGWRVVATARREERLERLSAETGCTPVPADLTVDDDVAALVAAATASRVTAVVHVAGGALGLDTIADAQVGRWQTMFDRNVVGTLRLTRAMLPHLRAHGGGDLLYLTSTAAHDTYPGGGGYVAAKHAERIIPLTLRQELVGEPIRVIEIAPGMVRTEEFSLNRLGSAEAAAKVYEGVAEPLVAADVAAAIVWALELPRHVNVDTMILRPVAQATNTLVARRP
ncbi:MAG: SDR family NAD(P)-dependent oxidoreductase [Actinomycetales bacterium]|nr:SDR family NAD(P)-dependent oxidoreductase [Actinomycetales bacterium]